MAYRHCKGAFIFILHLNCDVRYLLAHQLWLSTEQLERVCFITPTSQLFELGTQSQRTSNVSMNFLHTWWMGGSSYSEQVPAVIGVSTKVLTAAGPRYTRIPLQRYSNHINIQLRSLQNDFTISQEFRTLLYTLRKSRLSCYVVTLCRCTSHIPQTGQCIPFNEFLCVNNIQSRWTHAWLNF